MLATDLEVPLCEQTGGLRGMPGLVHLLHVIRFGEVGLPDLPEQRPPEVKELVLLEVRGHIRLLRLEVVCGLPV